MSNQWRLWKTRRRVRRDIASIKKRIDKVILEWPMSTDNYEELDSKLTNLQGRLDYLETRRLLNEADRLGIDIREDENPHWWYRMTEQGWSLLTQSGQIRVRKIIREEKLANRERIVRLIAPIIGALTGLIGTIIGLLAFWRSVR